MGGVVKKRKKGPRAIVTGGRDYDDQAALDRALDVLKPSEVATGAAPGADALARLWCLRNGVPCKEYRANWRQRGRKAGPERNAFMLDDFKPDVVIACPGGAGTADMVRRTRAAGIPIARIDQRD